MSKLRIKVGPIELDYDGTDEFIKNDLLGLISSLAELAAKSGLEEEDKETEDAPKKKTGKGKLVQLTTGSIASHLKVASGPDLVVAACAHLAFAKGLATFKRDEILTQMKTAASYYKKSYRSNLTSYLDRLVKGDKLVEASTDTFALKAEFAQELRAKLGID